MKIDPQTIEQLNAINKKYIDAANNHDAAARAALYTEDAVFLTDGGSSHRSGGYREMACGRIQVLAPQKPYRTDGSQFLSHS